MRDEIESQLNQYGTNAITDDKGHEYVMRLIACGLRPNEHKYFVWSIDCRAHVNRMIINLRNIISCIANHKNDLSP